ncbi:isochorismatase [Deinococcus cavernae]|uniref:isochorismatase n=1 Tax=Deinococcus cavernae TaxID=2320857 RepID=UPI0018F38858|nr:isochorismatase [Deinococcus cavernae]
MSLMPRALVLLNVQRHHLEHHPQERELARAWAHEVDEARARGELIVIVQWDGEAGSDHETFSRGWILHPDFRAETGDLLLRAVKPDAFATSALDGELRARAVRQIRFLALEGSPENASMTAQASAHGYQVGGAAFTPTPQPENA